MYTMLQKETASLSAKLHQPVRMSESFSWTKNAVWAASTLRARAAAITGLPLVPRAGEACRCKKL